jgi:hypothetical protein
MLIMRNKTRLIALLAVIIIGVIGLSAYLMSGKQQTKPVSILPKASKVELEEIPSSIALDDKLLKQFLIRHKIIQTGERANEAGLTFAKVIREDLNKDGEKEIIIGLGFEGPTMGWVGLIKKENEKYLLLQWENVGLAVVEMELKNIPQKNHQSLILKTGGDAGTGLFQREVLVYLIDEAKGQLQKLIWRGFLKDFGISGSVGSIGIDAEYNIEFKDIDEDGNIEIIQSGLIKKLQVSQSFEYVVLEESSIKNIFKYSYNESEYKLSSSDLK